MKIRLIHKLSGLLLLCGVVPLVAVSWLLIGIGRDQVRASVEQVHRLEAGSAASNVSDFLQRCRNRLVMDLEGSITLMPDKDVQSTLVWMLGKQDNIVTFRILAAHDDRGIPIGEFVHLPAESIPAEHRPSFLVASEDVREFASRLPLAEALKTGEVRLSEAYVNQRRGEALIAMAVPILDRLGQVRAVVSGEISLREVQRIVSDMRLGKHGFAFLVDAKGRPVAHPEFDRVRSGASMSDVAIVASALMSRRAGTLAFEDESGDQLGAHAPVFWGGWHLVVQQPAGDAYAPVTDMVRRAAFILAVALVVAVALGGAWVRSLVGPLHVVMDGMRRIVDGQFGHRLDAKGSDEVGELANAFNLMGRMLQGYKQEIEGWNRELQERVEAKSRALESTQAQLVQSAKLAAIGQLGAGVAHELNNPLAGVVGQTTLLKRRLLKLALPREESDRLQNYIALIEGEASRCREIVHGLLSFSQAGTAGAEIVNINDTVASFLVLVQANVRSSGVTTTTEFGEDLPQVEASQHQLQQVLMHLVSNAVQAMPDGGGIHFLTRREGQGVAIDVSDNGRGIAADHLDRVFEPFFTTKEDWKSPGLGLSVCYSIIESHGGKITCSSEEGRGTTFTIVLPPAGHVARRAARASGEEPVGLRRGRTPAATGA